VALDETSASDMLLQNAIDEGRLRKAPVLALRPWGNDAEWTGGDKTSGELREKLDRYLDEAERDDAAVQISALPMPDDILNLLGQSTSIDQLVVVGTGNPKLVAELMAPEVRKTLRHTNCSLLVLRVDCRVEDPSFRELAAQHN
jgi:hypothetical protein